MGVILCAIFIMLLKTYRNE